MDKVQEYRRAREQFFERHTERWTGTLFDAFDILAPFSLSRLEVQEIQEAAAGIAAIYKKTAELIRLVSDDALEQMGVPVHLLRVVRCMIPGMSDCVVGRVDLTPTDRGYKLLEFNTDVPGLLVEAFSINREVCRDAGRQDPNEDGEALLRRVLSDAVVAGVKYVGKGNAEQPNVVVTSLGHARRDKALAFYVAGLLDCFSATYAAIESLRIDPDALYDPSGKVIDVLYRVFPLRYFRNELFQFDPRVMSPEMGGQLLRLVERRRLAIINPPSSYVLESKATQALIWNLFESGHYFGDVERRLIDRYMLPTYLDPPPQRMYVEKPAYGFEGDTIRIVDLEGRTVSQSIGATYCDRPKVYQHYVTLPLVEMMTEDGPRKLHLVTSCFLLAGTPAGICMRAGNATTDESAWILPVCGDSMTKSETEAPDW